LDRGAANISQGEPKMPLPETLRTELGRYLIGQKLRALRLRRSMGLAQLGERTNLSPALLSKIENGRLVPTLPTLMRIAMVFEVTLDHFFQSDFRQRVISITRKEDHDLSFTPNPAGSDSYQLTRLDLGLGDRKFQPYLAEFFPETSENCKPHTHQGVEFIHVMQGTLEVTIGADVHELHPGDSIYFDSGLRHSYRRVRDEQCMGFMVFAYPERNVAERRTDRLERAQSIRGAIQQAIPRPESLQKIAANGNGSTHRGKSLQQAA
jgi:transcriptional regulator with XRE-family HTH domain